MLFAGRVEEGGEDAVVHDVAACNAVVLTEVLLDVSLSVLSGLVKCGGAAAVAIGMDALKEAPTIDASWSAGSLAICNRLEDEVDAVWHGNKLNREGLKWIRWVVGEILY